MSATVPAAKDEPDRLPRRLPGPPRGVERGPAVPVMPRRRLLLAGATWCAMRAVAEEPVEARSALRVTTRAGGVTRVLDGRMIVEAADGGLLLELADQRYEILQPDEIVSRERLGSLPLAPTPKDLGQRIQAELPPGFETHVTRHYVVCFDTSRDYARWAASLFERLAEAFLNYWSRAGLEVAAPREPLIVVIFAEREGYERYAARDLGAAVDRVVGYYNLMSNRVATYDLTGSESLRSGSAGGARRGPAEILALPDAAPLVSTLVHEATHQMAFNCGLHARLAPVPVWVSEGVATFFETPDLRSRSGWRGIGTVNRHRLERFRRTYRPGELEALVGTDDRFRDPATAPDAYAAAWALTWFLISTKHDPFVRYLGAMAGKTPFAADTPAQRLEDFAAAFAAAPADLEPALERHMARLETRTP